MKRALSVLFALVFVLGMISSVRAQERDNTHKPITSKGSMALVFDFGGLDMLDMRAISLASILYPGEGEADAVVVYGAGMKYYLADDFALRALLGFSTKSSGDPDPTKSPAGKTTTTTLGIGVGAEMHTHAVYAISPYFGAQLSFGMASSDHTQDIVDAPHGKSDQVLATTTNETKYSGSVIGIGVLAGFDWYVFDGVALGAEYSLGFSSASASSTVNGTKTDGPSTTAIGIGSGGVHLLLHF